MNELSVEQQLRLELPAAQSGDAAAFGRIVASCQGAISAIALAITRDFNASEDIAQDAFLTAWRKLRTLENPASFLPWLRQITRNLAREHGRELRRHAPLDGDLDAAIAEVADPALQPAEQVVEEERQRVLSAVLDTLPEDSRELLLLYYREGQRSQQVAALLGLSDASVRKRLSRVRQLVRDEFLLRFEACARATAPGAAFTASVVAAAGMTVPGTASAGALAGLSALASKGAAVLAAPFLGFVIGVGGGLLGAWFGLRKLFIAPTDAAEHKALKRFAWSLVLATIGFPLALIWATGLRSDWPAVILALSMALYYGLACGVWLPRILARRPRVALPFMDSINAAMANIQQEPAGLSPFAQAIRRAAPRLVVLGAMCGWLGWYYG